LKRHEAAPVNRHHFNRTITTEASHRRDDVETQFTGFWETNLSNDMLIGAAPIATWLYGKPEYCRRVFHLVETSRNFPHFKLGSKLHVRKSVMLASIWAQEERHWNDRQKELVRLHLELNRAGSLLRNGCEFQASPSTGKGQLGPVLHDTAQLIERLVRVDRASAVA